MLSERQDYSSNPILIQAALNLIEKRRAAESRDAALLASRAGLDLDPWQLKAVRSHHAQLILNCSRQAGKSTVTSIIALHTALYRPDSLILLLSPSLHQSQELFRKIKDAYGRLGSAAEAG